MSKRNKEYIFIGSLVVLFLGLIVFTRVQLGKNAESITKIEIRVNNAFPDIKENLEFNEDGRHTIKVKNGHMTIVVENEVYWVEDVDCPDKICESVGEVKKGSDKLIVCLPNDIVIVQV